MSLPNSDFERMSMENEAERAITSHNKPEYVLDPEARAMRKKERTGIELTDAELAYWKKITAERIVEFENRIDALSRSLDGALPNRQKTETELEKLEGELDFLKHNFAEKLFKDRTPADEGV